MKTNFHWIWGRIKEQFEWDELLLRKDWIVSYPRARLLDEIKITFSLFKSKVEGNIEFWKKVTSFSAPMINVALDEFERWLQALEEDLAVLNCEFENYLWKPAGLLLHVGAGNVFIGALMSLVQGLIVGNTNIVKTASTDPHTCFEFIRLAASQGFEFSRYVTVLRVSRDHPVLEYLKKNVDCIAVYGSENAINWWKDGTLAKVRDYGPKYGLAIVEESVDLKEAARKIALDVKMWDQASCSSIHTCFFIGSRKKREEFAKLLLEAMLEFEKRFNVSQQDDEFVEVWRARSDWVWQEFGNAYFYNGAFPTVLTSNDCVFFKTQILNGVVCIAAFNERKFSEILKSNTHYLQTVVLAVSDENKVRWQDKIAGFGLRIKEAGTSWMIENASPHDGAFTLHEFSKAVEVPEVLLFAVDKSDDRWRNKWMLDKLNELLWRVKENPWVRNRLKSVKLPLRSLDEFKEIEVASPELFTKDYSDYVREVAPKFSKNGSFYLFSSGGTTSLPKKFYWTPEEFEYSTYFFAEGFLRAGFNPDRDRIVANLMMPGGLWTAFLAVNRALEKLGCQILPIGSALPKEEVVKFLKVYKPTTIFATPTMTEQLVDDLPLSVRRVFFAGEKMPSNLLEKLRARGVFVASFGYAAVDVGPIGFQNGDIDEFSVFSGYIYAEVAEDGQLVVTNLNRVLQPVVRYKVGDVVEILDPGEKWSSLRFRLKGRSGFIKIAGSLYPFYYFDEAVRKAGGDDWQVIVEKSEDKYLVKVTSDADESLVRKNLLELSFDLKTDISSGLVDLIVVRRSKSSFVKDSRTGKVKRVIYKNIE